MSFMPVTRSLSRSSTESDDPCRTLLAWLVDLQERGVGLKVLTGDIDTTTITGRLVIGIFATLTEFERDLIHERTMAGLVAARTRCPCWQSERVS